MRPEKAPHRAVTRASSSAVVPASSLRAIRTIVKRIVGFLRVDARNVTSVLDRDLDEWQLHLRSYLIDTGAYRPETHSHLTPFAAGK